MVAVPIGVGNFGGSAGIIGLFSGDASTIGGSLGDGITFGVGSDEWHTIWLFTKSPVCRCRNQYSLDPQHCHYGQSGS